VSNTTCSCTTCTQYRPDGDPNPGAAIPGYVGTCARPEGLCTLLAPASVAPEPAIPEMTPEHEAELMQMQNSAALADKAVLEAEDIHKAIGRIEGIEFVRRVGDFAIAQVFADVRKSKKYKGLPYRDESGNVRHVGTFEEFCEVKLGKSYKRCHELAQNLHLLGSGLYEAAENIGFKSRDYRALKALPAEEQAVVKQALESESKDEVLDILQDLAARHQAEKEAAKKERENLTADLEARSRLLEDKAKRLQTTEEELYKLKSLPPDANLELKLAREEEAVERLHREHMTILASIKPFFQAVSEILGDEHVSAHTKEHAVFEVRQVCETINQFLLDCSIPVDFTDIVYPEWARGAARADIEAGNTEEPGGAHGSW
jgi:hypothetical protein